MKEGVGTFRLSPKGNTGLIYIPAKIVIDSAFPLKPGKVKIKIQNDTIIIHQTN